MINSTGAKIRLVRCPRCWKILPEFPDVPVYKCGGCGIHLQAKIRKENAKSTTLSLPETDVAEMNKLDSISESEKFTCSSQEAVLHAEGECSLDQKKGRGQTASSVYNGEELACVNLPNDEENNPSDQNGYEDFDRGRLEDVNLSDDYQKSESKERRSGVCDNEKVRVGNLSNEDHNNDSDQNDSLAHNIEQHRISIGDSSSNEHAYLENGDLPQFSLLRKKSEVGVNDKCKLLAGKQEANASNESSTTFRRSSQVELVDANQSTSVAAAHQPAGESISSDILISSPNESLELPQESAHHGFDHVRSTDTIETTDFFSPRSEFSSSLIDLSKSPTTRSSRAYYGDGVSSYEGTDDQLPDRHRHSCKHTYRPASYAASDMRPRRERFPVSSNNEMQRHHRNSASILPEKTHNAVKSSKLDQDELPDPARLGHPVRNWRRLGRDEYLSQHPFNTRESLAGHENSPSDHNEFYYKLGYTEQEKMKLLRMVYELQNQLNLNDKANIGDTWQDCHIPYYDNEVPYEENFHNLLYPRHSGRVGEGSHWAQQKKYSRIPFSTKATRSRHQVDHSLCCCQQERQHSAKFPPPWRHHSGGVCSVHHHQNIYGSYGSWPSSPQRYVDSAFPIYSRGTKSDDQRLRDHEMKRNLREKHHLAKHHLRPLAGGAPFITCSSCSKLLQLPADFLLFKRKFHWLKCGACSEVLKFSLLSRTHLIPYMPSAETPPPSEIDEHSDAIHRRNFTSTSHVSDCPCADSTDDYDRDPVSETPSHAICDSGVVKDGSYSSLDHSEDRRKFALNQAQNKGKNPVETYESADPSSSMSKSKKVSSEIEELPSARGGESSPLHRLMGYSSLSQVIYGYGHVSGSYHPEKALQQRN